MSFLQSCVSSLSPLFLKTWTISYTRIWHTHRVISCGCGVFHIFCMVQFHDTLFSPISKSFLEPIFASLQKRNEFTKCKYTTLPAIKLEHEDMCLHFVGKIFMNTFVGWATVVILCVSVFTRTAVWKYLFYCHFVEPRSNQIDRQTLL